MIIFLTLAPTFIILTISYETLFYFTFSINLFAWIEMEAAVYRFQAAVARGKAMMAGVDPAAAKEAARLSLARKKANGPAANGHQNGHVQSQAAPSETLILSPKELLDKLAESTAALSISAPAPTNLTSAAQSTLNPLTLSHLRTSLFFLTLLQSAFFSTGNMATVSSFSLDSVYRLIPIFDPFSQGALLILKLMIPFALLSAALGVLNGILGLGRGALVGVAMGVSEVMTLVFFWSVRDEGSWLEIGTGISHFVIAGLMGLFCAGLEGLGGLVVGGLDVRAEMREEEVPVEELLGEQLEDGKDSSFREEIQRGVEKMMGEVGSSEGREMTN